MRLTQSPMDKSCISPVNMGKYKGKKYDFEGIRILLTDLALNQKEKVKVFFFNYP